jgi:cystathionine beta-lyase
MSGAHDDGTPGRIPQTLLTQAGRAAGKQHEVINPPVVRGSTVLHESVAEMKRRVAVRAAGADRPVNYGVYGSATHHALCDALTDLEGGHQTWILPSGLSACTTALLAYTAQGDHVLVPDSVYWPVRRFCRETLPRYGIAATFYDPCIGAGIDSLAQPNTRLLWLESPGSLTFEMQDIPLLAQWARSRGIVTVADNTWATPLLCNPLRLGADVVVHALTKYIGGHSDLLLGSLTATEPAWPRLRETVHHLGLTAGPDDCWLALRGLRSLAARLPLHAANAQALVDWFQAQPEVERVLYPALPDDPDHALWRRDMRGASGLFGVQLKPVVSTEEFHAFVDALKLFGRGYSWGGYESLLIPVFPERTVRTPPGQGPLFRVSAGLEHADDLIADLRQGVERLRN